MVQTFSYKTETQDKNYQHTIHAVDINSSVEKWIAEIRILSPHFFENYLFVGQHFEIGEGPKVVGHGEILEIINPKLR